MKENICAIFLPQSYSRLCHYEFSNVSYVQQKIALYLEQLIRTEQIHRFIINLHGSPAIDTAYALLRLKTLYPYISLEFVDSNKYSKSINYGSKIADLLSKADNAISQYEIINPPHKNYFANHNIPLYFVYPFQQANYVISANCSYVLRRIFNYAEFVGKNAYYFNL